MKYNLSYTGINAYLEDLHLAAWKLAGDERKASASTQAISWYIMTGRASTEFIQQMFQRRPSTIAKACLAGGSDEDILQRVKAKVLRG